MKNVRKRELASRSRFHAENLCMEERNKPWCYTQITEIILMEQIILWP